MEKLASLLEAQERLEARYSDFLASLNRRRVVLLSELLSCKGLERLRAPWLNQQLFSERLGNACAFLENTRDKKGVRGYRRLFFFQGASSTHDMRKHMVLCRRSDTYREIFNDRYGVNTTPHVFYLHTNPKWHRTLTRSWKTGGRTIPPLAGFSNFGDSHEILGRPYESLLYSAVLGFQLPNWPELLNVDADTATEYFARTIIHDIGHDWCPPINPSIDGIHNSIMLYAGGATQEKKSDSWTHLVRRECTDPYFFASAKNDIEAIDSKKLSPLQAYLISGFRKWYLTKEHWKKVALLWGVSDLMPYAETVSRIDSVIHETCKTGFRRYEMYNHEAADD